MKKRLSLYVVAILMFFGISAQAFTGVDVKLYGDTSGDITLSVSNLAALISLANSMDDITDLPANTNILDLGISYNNYQNQTALMTGSFNVNISTDSIKQVIVTMSGGPMTYAGIPVTFNNLSYYVSSDLETYGCNGGGLTLGGSYLSCSNLGIDPLTLLMILMM